MAWKQSQKSQEILLPRAGETVAIARKYKTAALIYDRIWGIATDDIPESIRCFGETKAESQFAAIEKHGEVVLEWLSEILHSGKEMTQAAVDELTRKVPRLKAIRSLEILRNWFNELTKTSGKKQADAFLSELYRTIARSLSTTYEIPVAVIYDTKSQRDRQYKAGDRAVVVATLCNFGIVEEEGLSWEQVIEFREDEENRRKYRRFLHWLDKEMVGKSADFIEDEIALRLEDYERALKKHGIKTVLGTIEETLDGKYLAGVAGMVGSFTLTGHPVLGTLAGAGLMIGKMGVKLFDAKLDFDDVELGPNSEISWVYEVRKLNK